MANSEKLMLLQQGVEVWNSWREQHPDELIDLSATDLSSSDLSGINLENVFLRWSNMSAANLRGAILRGANLRQAELNNADLTGADLTEADLSNSYFIRTKLSGADLAGADLFNAFFDESELSNADLTGTILSYASFNGATLDGTILTRSVMVGTSFAQANLSNCRVFGISAWKLNLEGATQSNLIITDDNESVITVDSLEVAQLIYLLLHNTQVRNVIDTITSKAVLILGRFKEERKTILDAIREELRYRNYLPILFDFEKPSSRDLTETIVTLAHMARFVIADLTAPQSIPHELMSFVRDLPSVAVQPIILKEHRQYAMFEHLQRYPWVLSMHEYETQEQLIEELVDKVIRPAEAKVQELRPVRRN